MKDCGIVRIAGLRDCRIVVRGTDTVEDCRMKDCRMKDCKIVRIVRL